MDAKNRLGSKERPSTERFSLTDVVQQTGASWLISRATKYGFTVGESTIKVDGYRQHRAFKQGNKHPIRFSTLDFTGILTVEEPETLIETLYKGIGPAKAFGLLLVRRI